MTESDEAIVRQVLDGHAATFEVLVERYQTVLFNLALRILGDHDDARDAVQTAFMKAYQKLDTFDSEHRFFSWLYRIGMNESLNASKKRRPMEEVDIRMTDPAMGPAELLVVKGLKDAVQSALMQLTLEYRQIVVLRHFADLSHRDIAELLGIPEMTVKSRLFTARRLLEQCLARKGVTRADG
ncbi:MAG: sigma-70 family RNA polymerase sigma factor [Candidatus Eisenbacteria bacterium]|nr:sigma-70 family RNA polymerase sigma factor [Candidatus Eisenbacteria bacterium]